MGHQKLFLYGALSLVLVMIWHSWIEFQDQYSSTSHKASTSTLLNTNGKTNRQPMNQRSEDVPDAPKESRSDSFIKQSDKKINEFSSEQIIYVSTDLINAKIDTHGGDLIEVELIKHPVSVDRPDEPFSLMHRGIDGLLVAQNGLIGNDRSYPNHHVDYSVDALNYSLDNQNILDVELSWTAPDGVRYKKVFTFTRDSYRIQITYLIDNQSSYRWDGYVYGQLKQTEFDQKHSTGILGRLPSYHGAAIYTKEKKYEKIDYGEMKKHDLNVKTKSGWVAMIQHYFVASWLPLESTGYQIYSGVGGSTVNPQYRIGYKSTDPVSIPPGESGSINTAIFIGPKEQVRLDKQGAEGLNLTVDYGWLTPVSDPLFWLLNYINSWVKNWGLSIIILTVLVKSLFYPLSAASYKSIVKIKNLQPRLKILKQRYSDDKQKFQHEIIKLYKTEHVNPAGGCLPVLVQIPVFMALYWVLLESVELRQANFVLWLKDLSLPDPYFVLPIVMGASMLAQHFLNPNPVDPLQKGVMMAMPIVFTVFFLWFPSGLVLYWVVNNIISIAQQYHITKKYQNN